MTRKITPGRLAEEELRLRQIERALERGITTIDSVAERTLDQAVRFYGIRAVVFALEDICDRRAKVAAENFNTVAAKQWVDWWLQLEVIATMNALTDPGRE